MDYIELVTFIIKSLVKDPESVSVKEFESDDDEMHIHVFVDEAEMGNVIGKGGAIANAVRTIAQAASYAHNDKKIRIHIENF